jgi:plasmid stability protein
MANLTITVDNETLRRARIRALERGTSVNALLRAYLEAFTGGTERERAIDALLALSRRSKARLPRRKISREELHER